jgi:phage-related tail protein
MKKINISFKENELEKKIWDHLEEQSKLTGKSTYIKQLIYKDLLNSTEKK